jgi:hypothetical protein
MGIHPRRTLLHHRKHEHGEKAEMSRDAHTPWGAILLALTNDKTVRIQYDKEQRIYVVTLEYRSGKRDTVAIPVSASDVEIADKMLSIVGLREIF